MLFNQEVGLQLEYQLSVIMVGKVTTSDTQSSDISAQYMCILWDLGMHFSSCLEVNVFSGSQDFLPMEQASVFSQCHFNVFSQGLDKFSCPIFLATKLLLSLQFLLCHQYFFHDFLSCRILSSCSFLFGVSLEVFVLLFPYPSSVYRHSVIQSEVALPKGFCVSQIQDDPEMSTLVLDMSIVDFVLPV